MYIIYHPRPGSWSHLLAGFEDRKTGGDGPFLLTAQLMSHGLFFFFLTLCRSSDLKVGNYGTASSILKHQMPAEDMGVVLGGARRACGCVPHLQMVLPY